MHMLRGQRVVHDTNFLHNQNPGPGQYGPSTTTNASSRGVSELKLGKLIPGQSFGKSGLTRDNSGQRELSFHAKSERKQFALVSPRLQNAGPLNAENLTSNVSLISLRNKNHIKAAESQASPKSAYLAQSLNATTNSQSRFKQIQSQAGLEMPISFMIKDQSITNLPQMPFIESKKDLNLNMSPSMSGLAPVSTSGNLQINNASNFKKSRSPLGTNRE